MVGCWPNRSSRPSPALRTAAASSARQIAIDWIEDGFPQPLDEIVDLALQMVIVLEPQASAED
jgi:hypothetical protein